jgi:hypothetical protein
MRAALHAGDPSAARNIAAKVPGNAAIRRDPDFLWMLASANFLSRRYAAAEGPLLELFHSRRASLNQKAAAAYGLAGVYWKTGNHTEEIRFALWRRPELDRSAWVLSLSGVIADGSVYWAVSGWDLGLLLDAEAPIDSLRAFLEKYPNERDARLVRYALAVRLARENQYEESAQIYEQIHAKRRALRMRQLAALHAEASRNDLPEQDVLEAKYKLAEFLGSHSNGIYFNDTLWSRFQDHALFGSKDGRLTRAERERLMAAERKLRDDQEEYWRTYLILREIVDRSGKTDLGRRAAQLAVRCVRRISDRFGRQDKIRQADVQLSWWLRRSFR